MKIKFIYKFIPIPVFYTNKIPERFGGKFCLFWIKIRPLYKDDMGLLEHELTHARQFWKSFWVYAFLYKRSRKWRLKWEIEGYRIQIQYYSKEHEEYLKDLFASFLAEKYNLQITKKEAYNFLWT